MRYQLQAKVLRALVKVSAQLDIPESRLLRQTEIGCHDACELGILKGNDVIPGDPQIPQGCAQLPRGPSLLLSTPPHGSGQAAGCLRNGRQLGVQEEVTEGAQGAHLEVIVGPDAMAELGGGVLTFPGASPFGAALMLNLLLGLASLGRLVLEGLPELEGLVVGEALAYGHGNPGLQLQKAQRLVHPQPEGSEAMPAEAAGPVDVTLQEQIPNAVLLFPRRGCEAQVLQGLSGVRHGEAAHALPVAHAKDLSQLVMVPLQAHLALGVHEASQGAEGEPILDNLCCRPEVHLCDEAVVPSPWQESMLPQHFPSAVHLGHTISTTSADALEAVVHIEHHGPQEDEGVLVELRLLLHPALATPQGALHVHAASSHGSRSDFQRHCPLRSHVQGTCATRAQAGLILVLILALLQGGGCSQAR
mmetsp:Transcript_86146/g.184595  ORF Transcript_86146/g.184595 Transcript_86146/m.184595 type:complete len:418 (+) Transcript_86146:183-1436(+)